MLALLAPLSAGAAALWLGQDAGWDLRNYHFYVPFAWLHGRLDQDVAVAHIATYYNPTLYLPFYWAVENWPPRLVGFVLGGLAGINAWLLALIAMQAGGREEREGRSWAPIVLALVGLLGAMAVSELGTSAGDNIVSILVLASLWMLLRWRAVLAAGGPRAWATAIFSGLPCGIAFGLKLPFAVYAVAACLALLAMPFPWQRRLAAAWTFGVGVLVGVAVAGGYWLLEMWQRYRNPLFPYFNDVFGSPWATAGSYRHEIFIPQGASEWLMFPFRFALDPLQVAEVEFRDLRMPLLYAAAVLLLLRFAWRRVAPAAAEPTGSELDRQATTFLAVFAVVAFVLWARLFAVSRYTMPIEMLAPVIAWSALGAHAGSARHRTWLAVALGLLLVGSTQIGNWGRRSWSDDYFGVTPPAIADPDRSLVLLAGVEPMGYLVPTMPARLRFLRIDGHFTGPSPTPNASDRAMHAAVESHDGPIFLLYRGWEQERAAAAAAAYGLTSVPGACQSFLPGIEPIRTYPFQFCAMRKIAAK